MGIGERIKIARRAAGLSQRALAAKADVSAMAISKYERDLDAPSSGALLRLARALGVTTEYLLRPITVSLSAPAYRRRVSLPRKQEQAIMARIQDWLERYLIVESFFGGPPPFDLPATAVCPFDVEDVAVSLRQEWNLGLAPIENMTEVLEDKGVKVGLVEGGADFDGVRLWANSRIPIIAIKRGLPGDRQRFNLAHELGHLVLERIHGRGTEDAALRFAGALLAPASAVRFELGERRQTLDLYELHLLKHKYGLSVQAWIYRAKDLGIVSESAARRLGDFRQRGWSRQEPGDQIPPEEPERMKRLVLRALAEDLISSSRAAELLGMPLSTFWQQEAAQHAGFPITVRR